MTHRKTGLIHYATAYEDQTPEPALVIPESFAGLSADEVAALHSEALSAFKTLYTPDTGINDEDMATLGRLTEGIEALSAEIDARDKAAADRNAEAAEFATRVMLKVEDAEIVEDDDKDDKKVEVKEEVVVEESAAAESVTAAAPARQAMRITLPRSRQVQAPTAEDTASGIESIMHVASDGLGFAAGTGITLADAGKALNAQLKSFNETQYRTMSAQGHNINSRQPLLTLARNISADHTITNNDPEHVAQVFARAADESRLEGGSLVASGGWCAPSETLYDIVNEDESRDGLLSLPEIGVTRGGVNMTQGPDFIDIFKDFTGFHFTEQDDVDGKYAVDGLGAAIVGDKPCHTIECPPFEEYRLDVDGLCITGGILQNRAYPEVQARIIRGALVAHSHRMNANTIGDIVAGSDAVVMPSVQVGATAPLLTAIELQVEHYKTVRRLSRSTTLEAVLPYWVRGVIRSDLSRRLGVDLIDVNDARIDGWFRTRGINPQYVYNWQAITGAASAFTEWPDTVDFLLYKAGTWVRGVSDIITLDSLYDSTTLGQNNYVALFTEEGSFTAKRGHDSRKVTVSLQATGAANIGELIAHDGTAVPPVTEDEG